MRAILLRCSCLACLAGLLLLVTTPSHGQGVTGPALDGGKLHWILQLGESAQLEPVFTGTRPLTVQWRKNGVVLSGITTETLSLNQVTATHAGEYEVRVSNAAGQASANVAVAVFDYVGRWDDNPFFVTSEAPFVLHSKCWGPGKTQWHLWLADRYSPSAFSDMNRPLLKVHAPDAVSDGSVEADWVLGPESRVISQYTIVDKRAPKLISAPSGRRVVGGGEEQPAFVLNSYRPIFPQYSAVGLPKGITLLPDGTFQGGYPKGTHRVTWKVTDDRGSSTLTTVLRVDEHPTYPMAGTFVGLVAEDLESPDFQSPTGMVRLQVTASGTYTGQYHSRGRVVGFAGAYRPLDPIDPNYFGSLVSLGQRVPGIPNAYLALSFPSNREEWRVRVSIGHLQEGSFAEDLGGNAFRVAPVTAIVRQTQTGAFSGLLKDTSRGKPKIQDILPTGGLGSGIGTLSISANGLQATGIGTLADGNGFTFSSALVSDLDAQPGTQQSIPVYHTDSITGNSLYGWMRVSLNGGLLWGRAAKPGNISYPEGFRRDLQCRWVKRNSQLPGTPLLAELPDDPLNADFSAAVEFQSLVDASFQFTSSNNALFPAPNASRLRLDFFAPTGFFTGQMILPGQTKPVSIRGMIPPGLDEGGGFFLHLGAGNSIVSGKITLEPRQIVE